MIGSCLHFTDHSQRRSQIHQSDTGHTIFKSVVENPGSLEGPGGSVAEKHRSEKRPINEYKVSQAPLVLHRCPTTAKSHQESGPKALAVSTGGSAINARSAEAAASVSMGGSAMHAMSAEGLASVSMGSYVADARSEEEATSVSTGGNAVIARNVEEPAFVSTGDHAVGARSAGVPASVSTDGNAVCARSVEGAKSVTMGGNAVDAKSAEGPASVSMGSYAVSARSAQGPASTSTGGDAVSARSVEGPAFVSTGDDVIGARSAGAPASVSMSDSAVRARNVRIQRQYWSHCAKAAQWEECLHRQGHFIQHIKQQVHSAVCRWHHRVLCKEKAHADADQGTNSSRGSTSSYVTHRCRGVYSNSNNKPTGNAKCVFAADQ